MIVCYTHFTICFFFNDTATTEIYTLSLHDALPISPRTAAGDDCPRTGRWELCNVRRRLEDAGLVPQPRDSIRPPYFSVPGDRKSTRLNSVTPITRMPSSA